MSPDSPHEELRRLAAGLKEFISYQRRLGLHLLEGAEPDQRIPTPASAATPEQPEKPDQEPETGLSLEQIRAGMGDCRRCQLWESRQRLVFGVGDPKARLMFIGEAPGAEEDRQGEPFVGEAGQLLNRLLAKMELRREEVYITNVIKSRPPGNRTPVAAEIAACRPFLLQQIQAIRPEIIVTLGAVATQALLETKDPITRLRGKWHKWRGLRVMPTFHPSYLLRVPTERLKTWEDMQKVMAIYGGQGE